MTPAFPASCAPAAVASISLPPWDRQPGGWTALTHRVGQHVALTAQAAAAAMGTNRRWFSHLIDAGIVRDARIFEHRHTDDGVTHVCTTPEHCSRLYLEYGETLEDILIDRPEDWDVDAGERDYEGRTAIRIRPRDAGAASDMIVVTDRRIYNVRLVPSHRKITLACSWTYPGQVLRTPRGRTLAAPGAATESETTSRRTRFILFELGPTIKESVWRWADALRPTKAWQLQQYRKLHAKAGVPLDWGHPRHIIDAVIARQLVAGGLGEAELRQYLAMPSDDGPFVALVKEIATGRRQNRVPLPPGASPSMDDLTDPFPFLSGLPETWFGDPDMHEVPPEAARRLAWAMAGCAPHAALFATVAPRYIRRPGLITQTLRQLSSLERAALAAGDKLDLGDATSIDAAALLLLDGPSSRLGLVTRLEIVGSVIRVVRTLRRYIRRHDADGGRGLHPLRPADPADLDTLLARLAAIRKELGVQHRRNRKTRVHEHAGRLMQIEFGADLNLEQVVITSKALAAADGELGDQPFIDVAIPITIVDAKGRLRPGKQRCVWRVWNARTYLSLLFKAGMHRCEIENLQRHIRAIDGGSPMAPIHEYRRTEGVQGSTPIEPFFVRCWRFGLMCRPASLPPRLIGKRDSVIRELRLPGFSKCQTGLMDGTADEMYLWRLSLWQGRTIAFLDPFEHALRFAHLGLSSVIENLSRRTAWLQQTQDQSGWQIRRLNRQPVAGFLAHDKMSPHSELPDQMTWFPVGPKHQAELEELVDMTCRRCGYADGMLPEIHHLEALRWKRPNAQAWVFSFAGEPVHTSDLGRFLDFLTPGIGKLTYHDVRHLIANAAFEAGVPGWMIRLCLNHGATELWLYYAELSEAQLARIEDQSISHIFARSADLRSLAAA